jgi:hypothetical protein
VAGSPGLASRPFLAVFENSAAALVVPVYAGAVAAAAAAVLARRRGRGGGTVLALGGLATAYMVVVALLAEAGTTGNLRYVTLPAALLCVLSGAGWVALVRAAGRRAAVVAALAALASLPWLVSAVGTLDEHLDVVRQSAQAAEDLPQLLDRVGGAAAVRRCDPVFTGPFEVQLVAWHLGVPNREVGIGPRPPGSVLALRVTREARAPGFRPVAQSTWWTLRRACP